MRIQFFADGHRSFMVEGEIRDAKAIAIAELDMAAVRSLVNKARGNVNGRAKSGPIQIRITEEKKPFRVTYTPDPGRPETRGVETFEIETFSPTAARRKARNHFEKLFNDRYSVLWGELSAEQIR